VITPSRNARVSLSLRSGRKRTSRLVRGIRETGASRDGGASPARRIDARIEELGDWRGATLARIRSLLEEADPEVSTGRMQAGSVLTTAERTAPAAIVGTAAGAGVREAGGDCRER